MNVKIQYTKLIRNNFWNERERDGCSLVCIGIEFKQEFAKDVMKKTVNA